MSVGFQSIASGYMTNSGVVTKEQIKYAYVYNNYLILFAEGHGKAWVNMGSNSSATVECMKLGFDPRKKEYMTDQQFLQQMLGQQQMSDQQRQAQMQSLPVARFHKVGELPDSPSDIKLRKQPKQESKMKEMLSDVREYIKEHRSIIYTVVAVILVDHFFLNGKLRGKLEELLNGALNKAQEKLNGKAE